MKRIVVFALLMLCFRVEAPYARDAIGLVTGPPTGTYITIGRDIAKISAVEGQTIEVKSSNGSIENIRRVTVRGENASLGIVQSDVLGFLGRSKNPHSIELSGRMRMMFPFYKEEVHVLAGKHVASFADLHGRNVAVGLKGSGSMLTAMNLFAITGVKPRSLLQMSTREGVVATMVGKADATIFTAGKPVSLFKNLEEVRDANDGKLSYLVDRVKFVPVTDPRVREEYESAMITSQDYDFVSEPVPTVAVTSVLMAFDFSSRKNGYYKRRCRQMALIGQSINAWMGELRTNGHPKWREVDLYRDIPLWERDECTWSAAELAKLRPEAQSQSQEDDLISVLQNSR